MYKRLFLVLAGISLLAGCGGSGGATSVDVPSAYKGTTTQATVTTANAKALSADAYSGSQLASAVYVGKATTDTGGLPPFLQGTAASLESCVASIVTDPKSAAKAVAAAVQYTLNGYSGTGSYSITVDQTSGSFSGTISFVQYQESATSPTMSGSIGFSGVYNMTTGTFSGMNITINGITGTHGGESFTMSGSMAFSTVGMTKTLTMSMVLADNVSARTYWIKDFTMALSGNLLTVNGTYYDHVHGYVVISTITPLTVTTIDDTPTSGRLLFSGSNGTKARLTFISGGQTVEADTTGTGTYVAVY